MTQDTPLPARIQWHEGMLLSPQHFQQESARVDALVAWHGLIANPHAWGVRHFECDQGLLASGLLRILRLEAVMPDGMVVMHQPDVSGDLELDLHTLEQALELGPVDVYLSLGQSRSMRDAGVPSRFKGLSSEPVEDEVSQCLAVDVPRMVPHLKLAAGAVPPSVWMSFKLLTVLKENEIYKLGSYLPPLLEVPRGSDLLARVSGLATQMRSKAAFLAKQSDIPSSRIEDRLSNLELRQRMSALVVMLPVLEALLRSATIQPYALYLALAAQLGPLSSLKSGAMPLMPPAWNHHAPLPVFEQMLQSAEDLMAEVSQEWRTRVFQFDGQVFELDMSNQELTATLIVGLRGLTPTECEAWMAGAVIGAKSLWPALTDRRVLGAARHAVNEAPEIGLRANSGYSLFAVEVKADLISTEQPLVIANANALTTARRPKELVMFLKG